MKVAVIHDWLTIIGGSERVFQQIALLFPEADIYTLIASKKTILTLELGNHKITTSFIQKFPFAQKKYLFYFPLFPLAIEQFDLSDYDLIISSSCAVAKGVLTNVNQIHICYCHSPIKYAWDLNNQYLQSEGLIRGPKGIFAKFFLHRLRQWDVITTNRVDHFIANSEYVSKKIKKIYNRNSQVIYPNVAINNLEPNNFKKDFYLTFLRLAASKKVNLIVNAFNKMPDKKLIVIHDGSEFKKLKQLASGNTILIGLQSSTVIHEYISIAKALIIAAEEDFSTISAEAEVCNTPIITLSKIGSKKTIIDNKIDFFYSEPKADSIIEAIMKFEHEINGDNYLEKANQAAKSSNERFQEEFMAFVAKVTQRKEMFAEL